MQIEAKLNLELWQMQKMKSLGSISSSGRLSTEENEDEEVSRLAISAWEAREEEIERKKMEVKEKVELQLGRAEEETKRLAQIWEVSSTNFCWNIFSFHNSLINLC